jgi:hypothetical protein
MPRVNKPTAANTIRDNLLCTRWWGVYGPSQVVPRPTARIQSSHNWKSKMPTSNVPTTCGYCRKDIPAGTQYTTAKVGSKKSKPVHQACKTRLDRVLRSIRRTV